MPTQTMLFLKSESIGPFAELPAEAEKLRWLSTRGVPTPDVLSYLEENGKSWLLTSRVLGKDLASSHDLSPSEIVRIAANALRDLHEHEIFDCPFDCRIKIRLNQARIRMEAGIVDEGDFDEERLRRTARDLFAELLASCPDDEDLVLTHGDACLPNLIANERRFTGFVDCGRAGIADRHQDLALAARSIGINLGEQWSKVFLEAYDAPTDRDRLAFFRLLDEFF